MKKNKKVLIIYATGGMGHVTAAKAVEEAFIEKYPDVTVKNIDVIDYASTVYKKFFVDGYNYVSSKYPEVWGFLYRNFDSKKQQKLPTLISKLAIESKFTPFIQGFEPDFIVCTHPLPAVLISHSKRDEVIDITSSIVVTDYGCHSFWVDKDVNYYFTATDSVKRCLQHHGVTSSQAQVTGIPIQMKFRQKVSRTEQVKKLGLDPDKFTLMIVGGQFEFSKLKKIINGISKNADNVQFIVIAGRDKDLKDSIESSTLSKLENVKTFGFVSNMHEMMSAADLIFSKAGGLTVSECMAKGLPMVIHKVIPGQEEDNVDYLVSKNAAVRAKNIKDIVAQVTAIVNDPKKLTKMKKAAKSIGKPNSAIDLADFVVKQIDKQNKK